MDTGATEHVCGTHDFTHAALKNGPSPALKTSTGELLKHNGTRTVDFQCQDEKLRMLHSCRCDVTKSECLKIDGQVSKHSSQLASSFCDDSTVRRLNSHVVVVLRSAM